MKTGRSIQIIYVLAVYVMVQLIWWGYRIVQLSAAVNEGENALSRSIWMIVGEGSVFLLILILGVWRLNKSIKNERKSLEKERNFILAVSHELKTPIAATKISLETLEKRTLTEEQKNRIVRNAMNANNRLEGLVENILHTSQIEQRTHSAASTAISLSDSAQQIIDRQVCDQEIRADIAPDITFKISTESFDIILENLIQNAIKYSPKDEPILVSLDDKNGIIELVVADRGPGIPEGEKQKIFEKFYRIGDERVRTSKGTGLGLYLCDQIVRLNRGTIRVIDNQPRGTRFKITFPND